MNLEREIREWNGWGSAIGEAEHGIGRRSTVEKRGEGVGILGETLNRTEVAESELVQWWW